MSSKQQSKPTYKIEVDDQRPSRRLVDRVVQASSFKKINVKEEVEELISNDPSFVRSISNAVNSIPVAGGTPKENDENVPADVPQEFNFSLSLGGEFESIKADLQSLAESLKSEINSEAQKHSKTDDNVNDSEPKEIGAIANNGEVPPPDTTLNAGSNIPESGTQAPELPEAPKAPEVPETSEVPKASGNTETPEVPENTRIPEVPENSEVPEAPKNIKAPEVPEVPETPKVPENKTTPVESPPPEIPQVKNPFIGEPLPQSTPQEIKESANELGKGKAPDGGDIRFERLDDGNFQQFINGSKGDVFTEADMLLGLNISSGNTNSFQDPPSTPQSTLSQLNEIGRGSAPDGGDIRYERLDDGTFQEFVDGSKGDILTEEEAQKIIDEHKDNDPDLRDEENESKTPATSDDSFPVPLDVTGEICIVGVEKFEIWDKIREHKDNSEGLTLEATVRSNSGFPTVDTVDFIDEYEPETPMSQLIEFDGAGVNRRQTKWKLPLAKKDSSSNGWEPLSQGGYYNLSMFCVNSVPCQYPLKNF